MGVDSKRRDIRGCGGRVDALMHDEPQDTDRMGRHFSIPKSAKDGVRARLLDRFDAVADYDGPGEVYLDCAGHAKRLRAHRTEQQARMKRLKTFTVVVCEPLEPVTTA